jgi:hypothetical protein
MEARCRSKGKRVVVEDVVRDIVIDLYPSAVTDVLVLKQSASLPISQRAQAKTYMLGRSLSNLNLVTTGIKAGSALKHNSNHLLAGGNLHLEAILLPLLPLSPKDPDLEFTIGGNHGHGVEHDLRADALDRLLVAMNLFLFTWFAAEVGGEIGRIDVFGVDCVVLEGFVDVHGCVGSEFALGKVSRDGRRG